MRDWRGCDGEIDYAEGTSARRTMHFFQHYSCDNQQTSATRRVDTTTWHNYAVEWTPKGVVGYLDGVEWFRDTNPDHQPPGSMHQTVQLDWFPDGTSTSRSWMKIAWVRVYDVPAARTAQGTGRIKLAVLGDINHDGNGSKNSREGKIAASIASWGPTGRGPRRRFSVRLRRLREPGRRVRPDRVGRADAQGHRRRRSDPRLRLQPLLGRRLLPPHGGHLSRPGLRTQHVGA